MILEPCVGLDPLWHVAERIQVPVVDVNTDLAILISKAGLEALGEALHLLRDFSVPRGSAPGLDMVAIDPGLDMVAIDNMVPERGGVVRKEAEHGKVDLQRGTVIGEVGQCILNERQLVAVGGGFGGGGGGKARCHPHEAEDADDRGELHLDLRSMCW